MPAMVPAKSTVVASVEVTSEMVASSEMTTSKMTTSMMVSAVMLRQCRLCHKQKSRQTCHGRQMLDHVPLSLDPETDQRHPQSWHDLVYWRQAFFAQVCLGQGTRFRIPETPPQTLSKGCDVMSASAVMKETLLRQNQRCAAILSQRPK